MRNLPFSAGNYSRAVSFAADIGCKLLSVGSPVNSVERAVSSVCIKFGAAKAYAFCVPDAAAVSATFEGREYTSLKRAYYGGNDLFIQEKCTQIVSDVLSGTLSLEGAERRLASLDKTALPLKMQAFGGFLACGAFAIFFGGNAADAVIAAIAGLATSVASAVLSKRGAGGCARVFLLSALSGLSAVSLCVLFQLIGLTCHASIAIVGTLMTLIPGLTVCNALSDIISGEMFSGVYRIFGGIAQTVCIVAGYALALAVSGGVSAFTVASPRADILHTAICYISGAAGASGFCLTMNARGKRLLCGVAAAIISYTAYVLTRALDFSEFLCYFVAAAAAYASAELPSRFAKIPQHIFVTPALMPLLPGASLYFAVNAIVCGDAGTAIACGNDALVIFTAIASGLAAAQIAARIILPKKHSLL
ncbi:MAG: threonine/serine exporter family protein [Clostridia bacterium]|nr:threonine/serine exporter family protein [Clostridia bacterium]